MSTFPPRECGIATFTKSLTDATEQISSKIKTKILAINKNGTNIYNYQKKVSYGLSDSEINDYIETAKKINLSKTIKLVNIQHEFGIFGGQYGEYLLAFLEVLKKPVVITFHSILPNPEEKRKKIVQAISQKVKEIVVMTPIAVKILQDDYQIKSRISVIPHGAPPVQLETQEKEKRNLGLRDKIILSSFGLISPGKGYEQVIESLPEVIKKFPNLIYLIVGETHPVIRKKYGEDYRNSLEKKVRSLGLQNHVKFYNKYLSLSEIIKYLKASDIYISSSLDPNQITSGTLSYAAGCGRAIISTPFLHAKDFLTNKHGLLAEFNNPGSFQKAIKFLLENPEKKKQMEIHTYHHTRHTTWPNIALAYNRLFKRYIKVKDPYMTRLPKINLSHLITMTDKFGIIQFAHQSKPDIESGYTLDDNARALLVCTMHYEKFKEYRHLPLIKTYLNYIQYVQAKDGKLYNYVDKHKKINSEDWSKDAQGRALWALGYLISSSSIPTDFKRQAENIFLKSLPSTSEMESPRSIAFTIKGLYFYNKEKNSQQIKENIKKLSDQLQSFYKSNSHKEWQWFEPFLTYANSKLPEALLYAYISTKDKTYLETALESLNFLISKTFKNSVFIPIGQKGWYIKDNQRAYYDQQPIEAAYTTQTLILAHKITNEEKYRSHAIDTFQWFIGKNSLNQVIYNTTTGGCYDGLGKNTINLNQGAESTLSYLIARLSLANL